MNDSKSHICNFFENIISGMQLIYIRPHVPVDISIIPVDRVFFKISDFLAGSLKANKN